LTARVLVVPGSLWDAAVTSQIASLALAATTAEVTVTLASGLGLMPLYNEDIDTPVPPGAVSALRQQAAAADAVLLISPSHNGSMCAALKNAIDWLSRPRGMAPRLGKPPPCWWPGTTSARPGLTWITCWQRRAPGSSRRPGG
jgi:NAD(P)H-dependent FMN reductase